MSSVVKLYNWKKRHPQDSKNLKTFEVEYVSKVFHDFSNIEGETILTDDETSEFFVIYKLIAKATSEEKLVQDMKKMIIDDEKYIINIKEIKC